MTSRRTARVARAILETVSSTILFGLKDPRVRNVTVLNVEVSHDIRTAKVYVSVMGTEKEQSLCLHGLNSARGYLQSKIADRLQTRYTPVLTFVLDQGVKKSIEASRLLREALGEANAPGPNATGSRPPATGDEADVLDEEMENPSNDEREDELPSDSDLQRPQQNGAPP